MSDSSRVRAAYDVVADDYAKNVGDELLHKPLDRALLRAFVEMLPGGNDDVVVGDVGCGPGHVTAFLASLGVRAIGIDLSPAMVRVATRRYPTLEFSVGSVLRLAVDDRVWSGALAMYSLIHLDQSELDDALRELHRVVRPGGLLLIAIHTEHLDLPGEATIHVRDWWGHEVDIEFRFVDIEVLESAAGKAGFVVEASLCRIPHDEVEAATRRAYVLARRAAPEAVAG